MNILNYRNYFALLAEDEEVDETGQTFEELFQIVIAKSTDLNIDVATQEEESDGSDVATSETLSSALNAVRNLLRDRNSVKKITTCKEIK